MSIIKLINSGKTVFLIEDIGKILQIENRQYLKVLVFRMIKKQALIRIKKGIYAINKYYNLLELANKLKRPSYISLDYVLFENNIIFQDYSNIITSISNNNYKQKINNKQNFF